MASFNKITIVGYLGRDPEMRYIPNGTAVCNVSVATTEKKNNRDGDAQNITTWFRITVWGKQAEFCNQYLRKGAQVYIEGRLRQEEYTDREGQTRHTLEVTATDVQLIGPRSDQGQSEAPSPEDAQKRREALSGRQAPNNNDDIPF